MRHLISNVRNIAELNLLIFTFLSLLKKTRRGEGGGGKKRVSMI